ncbi:DUF3866 family protein [Brevibacillus dissolubilis]|uniref:DUF3866 family protein n=1 Tax=Brevibacillus dissolubilis TaxID=1844116 RepID=UPI001116583E|nr:DUF3866 family protein [Brevibacillus dissolubilis]
MLHLREGRVNRIVEERAGVQIVEVEMLDGLLESSEAGTEKQGEAGKIGFPHMHTEKITSNKITAKAVYYTKASSQTINRPTESPRTPCQIGDIVILNTTAVDLRLGTGGYHFILAKKQDFTDSDEYPTDWGHIIKMRYTPWQLAVDAVEEQGSPYHELFCDETLTLERTPVLIGELHSLLPMLALSLHHLAGKLRIAYVMPDGAALPIAWSRHVHQLKEAGLIDCTVTVGHAWGGDYEAVNLHTGLLAAKHLAQADIILCILGPGVVGTGTPLGFSGMQLAEMIHAVSLLEGIPVVVPRISFAEARERHRGISHHTRTVLKKFALTQAVVPIPLLGKQSSDQEIRCDLQSGLGKEDDHDCMPDDLQQDPRNQLIQQQAAQAGLSDRHHVHYVTAPTVEELAIIQQTYPEPITTMGRDLWRDPSPFQTAYAAAKMALSLLS